MIHAHVHKEESHEQAFSTISRRSFFVVVILLLSIILFSWILTYIVPQGQYDRDESGMIIDGTFVQGPAKGIALWRVLTAPFRVFASEDALTIIMISVFLLIMSGVFNLLEKTDGLRVIIGRTVKQFQKSALQSMGRKTVRLVKAFSEGRKILPCQPCDKVNMNVNVLKRQKARNVFL